MVGTRATQSGGTGSDEVVRWECRGHQPPILLGTYDPHGHIHIKVRDRHWRILGAVQTRCPRCGAEHALDLRAASRESEVGSRGSRVESREPEVVSRE